MGAEHSQQQPRSGPGEVMDNNGRELLENDMRMGVTVRASGNGGTSASAAAAAAAKRRSMILRQGSSASSGGGGGSGGSSKKQINSPTASASRAPSPPLSVCSDLPYVSYTDRPIGDSPKMRSKPPQMANAVGNSSSISRNAARKSHPSGAKPKRPQSTASSHSIVIVKPGARDSDHEVDSDLARLRSIPQFLPVLRESISSATFTRDPEVLERLQTQHLLNICARMQTHLNLCATHVASEQNHLVERTKVVSNSITTLFASFVDMQKTYASYAEQFSKIRAISHQLSRCNSMLHENIANLEAINDFLDVEDRLEPFVWRTDDSKMRGVADGAYSPIDGGTASASSTSSALVRHNRRT